MKKYLLVLICLFFLITRLYKIGEIPSSVYWDEASIGYNAFSVLQTGKDEWGKFLPIHFRAFGEFKLPVYIYATLISEKFFGLNAFAVRLPAVLFSLGVVILTYLLSKRLSGITLGLLSSFFVTISPWFFIFSRTGYEATAGLMFYMLGIYLFLGLGKKSWYLLFSIASFILSIYSYNSFRIIIPLTTIILIIYDIRNLKSIFKKGMLPVILSGIIVIFSMIPIYKVYRFDTGGARLQTIKGTSAMFITNYFSHFSPDFLFAGDKNSRSQIPGFGQIYFPELVFLLLGFLYIIGRKSKLTFLSLVLLLLSPIPASLTRESPHALRTISIIPFIHIISAMGIIYLKQFIRFKYFELVILGIFFAFFVNYLFKFLTVYPLISSTDWQYEYKKIYEDFGQEFNKYNRILISDKYAQPYIFALFYLKYDPQKFQQEVIRNNINDWGFSTVRKFGKFEFGKFPQLYIFDK